MERKSRATPKVQATGPRGDVQDDTLRPTTGHAGHTGPSGTVFVREQGTGRLGYIGNNVPITGARFVEPGTRLELKVRDEGDVMVVVKASVA